MKIVPTSIPDVLILEPRVFQDSRGFFFESYNEKVMADIGVSFPFVQDNHSRSCRNVLRGLHYQIEHPQGKLVRTIIGEIFDVAVDLRKKSSTLGKWCGVRISAANRRQLYIPPGFAHGFLVLSEWSEVLYKTTDFWAPEHERCIIWNDEDLGINWPLTGEPVLSAKDRAAVRFAEAELYPW